MIFSLHNVYRTYCRWREFCQEASDKCISYQYIYVSKTRWIQFIIIRLYQLTCNEFLNIDFLFWVLRVPIMIYCIFCKTENLQRLQKPHTSMLRIVYSWRIPYHNSLYELYKFYCSASLNNTTWYERSMRNSKQWNWIFTISPFPSLPLIYNIPTSRIMGSTIPLDKFCRSHSICLLVTHHWIHTYYNFL